MDAISTAQPLNAPSDDLIALGLSEHYQDLSAKRDLLAALARWPLLAEVKLGATDA